MNIFEQKSRQELIKIHSKGLRHFTPAKRAKSRSFVTTILQQLCAPAESKVDSHKFVDASLTYPLRFQLIIKLIHAHPPVGRLDANPERLNPNTAGLRWFCGESPLQRLMKNLLERTPTFLCEFPKLLQKRILNVNCGSHIRIMMRKKCGLQPDLTEANHGHNPAWCRMRRSGVGIGGRALSGQGE